jgi:hypothetical protein
MIIGSSVEWGTVAEWAGATVTSGALVIAALTLRSESKARQDLERRLDVQRRQDEEKLARGITFKSYVVFDPPRNNELSMCAQGSFEVDNESDRTIHHVLVSGTVVVDGVEQRVLRNEECSDLPAHHRFGTDGRPTATYKKTGVFRVELPDVPEYQRGEAGSSAAHLLRMKLAFTDANGVAWITIGPGHLERLPPV